MGYICGVGAAYGPGVGNCGREYVCVQPVIDCDGDIGVGFVVGVGIYDNSPWVLPDVYLTDVLSLVVSVSGWPKHLTHFRSVYVLWVISLMLYHVGMAREY